MGRCRTFCLARRTVILLFFVSGGTGLVYEVTWSRALGTVFGNTVFAVSTVLTAFMLGLAVGSWLFGRLGERYDRPVLVYALLELGIGAYAFAFFGLLGAADEMYGWFFRHISVTFYPLSLLRFGLSAAILIVPSALMGGTLPVLSSLWRESREDKDAESRGKGRHVGLLYAVNTFGAVCGSFAAGYVLIRVLGVRRTVYVAGAINLAIGLAALVLWRVAEAGASGGGEEGTVRKGSLRKGTAAAEKAGVRSGVSVGRKGRRDRIVAIVPVVVAVGGCCALALEVLWTRVLAFVLGTSVYAFACMLTCFILGIGLGSLVCSRVIVGRLKHPVFALGAVQWAVAGGALLSIHLLALIGPLDYEIVRRLSPESFGLQAAVHFLDAAVVMLLPTFLMGFTFPIAVEACTRLSADISRQVGNVYASNTIGCVVGSFAAGFVMVPLLGLRNSFLLVVGLQIALGCTAALLSEKRRSRYVWAVAAGAVIVFGVHAMRLPHDVFLRTVNTYHYPSKIVYMEDGVTGTVTVHDLPNDRLIAVDGVNVAGMDLMLRTTQKLQGYVPLLMHERPEKVIQIGFGSGETSGIGLAFGVEDYRIVEVCPEVFEAGRYFKDINRGSYNDPRLTRVIMDGKNFIKLSAERFDIIMNDSTYPGTTGSSALYTYDHFLACREHLRDGGVLSCWLPLDLRIEDFRIILRSFQKAMPYCSLWMANNCLNKHAVLVGTAGPTQIDMARAVRFMERPEIRADLDAINMRNVYDLLDCFVADAYALRRMAGAGPVNTDDKPRLEFGAPIKRDEESCLLMVMRDLAKYHSPVGQHVANPGAGRDSPEVARERLDRYYRGTGHTLRGLVAMLEGDAEGMKQQFQAAMAANPLDRDVASCMAELEAEVASLAAAVERSPGNPTLRSRLARRYFLLEDYARAADHYAVFVDLEPSSAAAWNNLGIAYSRLKQFGEAVEAFRQAIRQDPQMHSAHYNLGTAQMSMGEYEASMRSFEAALAHCGPDGQLRVYERMAMCYSLGGRYGRAVEMIDRALELAPRNSAFAEHLKGQRRNLLRALPGQ